MAEHDNQVSTAIPDQEVAEVTTPEQGQSLILTSTCDTPEFEAFETFQHKVHALAAEQYFIFEHVHQIEQGPHNRVIGLTLYDPEDPSQTRIPAVLRIPNVWNGDLTRIPLDMHPRECGCGKHEADEDAAKNGSTEGEPKSPISTANDVLQGEDQDTSEADSTATTEYQESESSDGSSRIRALHDWTKQEPRYALTDEVVLLNYTIRNQNPKLPVPKVLAFDTSRNNALGLPYSIQTRIPGVTLKEAMENMSVEEKVQIAGEIAALQAEMNKIVSTGSGRVMARNAKKLKQMRLNFQWNWMNLADQSVVNGFVSGFNYMYTSRKKASEDIYHSLYELMFAQLEAVFRDEISSKFPDENLIRSYLKLKDMFEDMDNMGWFTDVDKSASDSVLYHSDLRARNIMVNRTDGPSSPMRITGIIDWDLTYSLPSVLTRRPPFWLWNESHDAELQDEVPYYDSSRNDAPLNHNDKVDPLTADDLKIKKRYEDVLVQKLYVDEYGDKAKEMYHDDAYGRGRWLRRLWRFSFEGIWSPYYHLDRVKSLDKEWNAFKKANGIADPTDKDKVIRVYTTSYRPPSPSSSDTSSVAGQSPFAEEAPVDKSAGHVSSPDKTCTRGNSQLVENAASPKKSARNKASDALDSFKCRPS